MQKQEFFGLCEEVKPKIWSLLYVICVVFLVQMELVQVQQRWWQFMHMAMVYYLRI